jgi:hypothetical protein
MLDFYAMSIFTLSFIIVQNNNHYPDNNFDICMYNFHGVLIVFVQAHATL